VACGSPAGAGVAAGAVAGAGAGAGIADELIPKDNTAAPKQTCSNVERFILDSLLARSFALQLDGLEPLKAERAHWVLRNHPGSIVSLPEANISALRLQWQSVGNA
jgi:hypothetical protein